MNFYAYCLSDEVTGGMIEGVAGIGGEPRLVQYGEVAAVVSLFEGESAPVTRENVFAHERVIGHVLAHTTPLPFRFGTVTSAARLESFVNSQRGSLQAQLARVRGCVEMSVKVIWNAGAAHREAMGHGAAGPGAAPVEEGSAGKGSGTAFLMAKRREILGDETLKAQAESVAAWLESLLGETVREMDVNVRPAGALIVAAAHMVERDRLEEYQERLRAARMERADLHFLTSGPWPPYSFSQTNS
jgi:Gas vesicle synthesis protein GvpL/GvpF